MSPPKMPPVTFPVSAGDLVGSFFNWCGIMLSSWSGRTLLLIALIGFAFWLRQQWMDVKPSKPRKARRRQQRGTGSHF